MLIQIFQILLRGHLVCDDWLVENGASAINSGWHFISSLVGSDLLLFIGEQIWPVPLFASDHLDLALEDSLHLPIDGSLLFLLILWNDFWLLKCEAALQILAVLLALRRILFILILISFWITFPLICGRRGLRLNLLFEFHILGSGYVGQRNLFALLEVLEHQQLAWVFGSLIRAGLGFVGEHQLLEVFDPTGCSLYVFAGSIFDGLLPLLACNSLFALFGAERKAPGVVAKIWILSHLKTIFLTWKFRIVVVCFGSCIEDQPVFLVHRELLINPVSGLQLQHVSSFIGGVVSARGALRTNLLQPLFLNELDVSLGQ